MATATLKRGSRKLSLEEIAERKRAAAAAELQRNGIEVSKDELRQLDKLRLTAKNAIFEAFEGESFVRDLIETVVHDHPQVFAEWECEDFCELTTRTVWQSPEPVKPAAKEFVSKPDAKAIPKAEVCNFEPLTKWDRMQIDAAVEDAQWGGWDDDDRRWTLTPAEWRKAKRRNLTQQKIREKELAK